MLVMGRCDFLIISVSTMKGIMSVGVFRVRSRIKLLCRYPKGELGVPLRFKLHVDENLGKLIPTNCRLLLYLEFL
jgi:hypothetical protein